MMRFFIPVALAAAVLPMKVAAQDKGGDTEADATQFDRHCAACHVVADDSGEVLAGRNARTGPNLFEVVGSAPGSRHDFAYSDPLVVYGETGATWTEDNMSAFTQDPSGHLREALDDPRARSKMAYRVRSPEEARGIYAFLAEFGVKDASAEDAAAPGAPAPGDTAEDTADIGGAEGIAQALPEDGGVNDLMADVDAGEVLYQATCRSCHGPRAQGLASFPELAGKDYSFLTSRLEQYRAGERVGPNSGLMIPVAEDLSDQDIANVSGYIATAFR